MRISQMSKRYLILGARGLLGRHLASELQSRKMKFSTDEDLALNYRSIDMVQKLPNTVDVVFNCAAKCGGIGDNQRFGIDYLNHNVQITTNIFDWAAQNRIPRLINFGSVCAYPSGSPTPIKEGTYFDGLPELTNLGYAAAKRVSAVQTYLYSTAYPNTRFQYLVLANLYGPHDRFDQRAHVIPALIKRFIDAKKYKSEIVSVWGSGNAEREFLYAKDAARMIVELSETGHSFDPLNLGSGETITIKRLAYLVAKLCGYKGKISFDASKPDGETKRLMDSSRAQVDFGCKPRVGLADGLKKTIAWYRGNANG